MKVEKTEFIGYVQLYMKFWVPEYPDCAFYATFDTDFSKPLTQCILESHWPVNIFQKSSIRKNVKSTILNLTPQNVNLTRPRKKFRFLITRKINSYYSPAILPEWREFFAKKIFLILFFITIFFKHIVIVLKKHKKIKKRR